MAKIISGINKTTKFYLLILWNQITVMPAIRSFLHASTSLGWKIMYDEAGFSIAQCPSRQATKTARRNVLWQKTKDSSESWFWGYISKQPIPPTPNISKPILLLTILFPLRTDVLEVKPHGVRILRQLEARLTEEKELHTGASMVNIPANSPGSTIITASLMKGCCG